MNTHEASRSIVRFTGLVSLMVFASSLVWAEAPTTPPAPSDQSVQERAVPRQPGIGSVSEVTGDAPGKETGGTEAVPPVVEGQPGPPMEAGDIQERGLHQGTTPGRPQGGTATGPPSNFQAPTPSLTAVANAIRVTSKSVSVNLRVPANAPVTIPVEISVAYISPVHAGRLTKTYDPSSGTIIRYHEAEGDRKPRPMRLDISLRELIPNGKLFSISRQFTLVPLFDVFISSLSFTSITVCDLATTTNDILLRWFFPDYRAGEIKFHNSLHERKGIREFKWARKEISTEEDLREPRVIFNEHDLSPEFHPPLTGTEIRLLQPGQPEHYSFILEEQDQGPPGSPSRSGGCRADTRYNIIRKLLTFDNF
jgi:hypothetical protein